MERALKKELTFLDIFCVATGAMISSGLFILPGLAFARAGPAVILSYVIAGIFCLPTLLSMAELTTAMPKAGGDYFYIMRGFGPLLGTLAGFSTWFSLSLKGGICFNRDGSLFKHNNSLIYECYCLLVVRIFYFSKFDRRKRSRKISGIFGLGAFRNTA